MRTVSQGPSQQEWEEMRPILTRFYFDQGKTLNEVCSLLARQYGFKATEHMYKDRIKQWGLSKKRKMNEMQALVAMAWPRQQAGKRSIYRIGKRRITLEEARKYFKRKGMTNLDDIAAQSVEIVSLSDLTCSTIANSPEPVNEDATLQADQDLSNGQDFQSLIAQGYGPTSVLSEIRPYLSSPKELKPIEQLLAAAKVYFSPSSTEFIQTIVRDDLLYSKELQQFERFVYEATLRADLADWENASSYYGKALDKVPEILLGNQSLSFLVCLFMVLEFCETPTRTAFIPKILEFVSDRANMMLSPYHPFCQLIHSITTSHLPINDMIELCFQAALGILKLENMSCDPRTRILEYGLYETLLSRGQFLQARQLIRETWKKEELLLGERHSLTVWSMMAVGRCAIELGDLQEADEIVSDVIQRCQIAPDEGYCSQLRMEIQEHIHSCTQLRRRSCQHRKSFIESVITLDNNSHTTPPFCLQDKAWFHPKNIGLQRVV
jgi:Clr5 domain